MKQFDIPEQIDDSFIIQFFSLNLYIRDIGIGHMAHIHLIKPIMMMYINQKFGKKNLKIIYSTKKQ